MTHPEHRLGGLFLTVGSLMMLSGVGVFGWQLLSWMKAGRWLAISLKAGLAYAQIPEPAFRQWTGMQSLWNQLAAAPLTVCLLVFGAIIAFIGGHFSERALAGKRHRDLKRLRKLG